MSNHRNVSSEILNTNNKLGRGSMAGHHQKNVPLSKLRRYRKIHDHCASCIRPSRCITRLHPSYHQVGSDPPLMSQEELYSLVLSVDYHQKPAKPNADGVVASNSQSVTKVDDEDYEEEDEQTQKCPVIQCPNSKCQVITHYCKLQEHFLLCAYNRVACINVGYGCPYSMLRKDIAAHLQHCPANVVHCAYEWNRWPLYTTEKSEAARIHCPSQALDVTNLDVALALRDQRMLAQLYQANRQIKRAMKGVSVNPAVPFKVRLDVLLTQWWCSSALFTLQPYIGVRTYREYTRKLFMPPPQPNALAEQAEGGSNSQAVALPTVVVHYDNVDEEIYMDYASRLCNAAYQDALAEIIKRNAQVYKREAKRECDNRNSNRKKSNSICQMMMSSSGECKQVQHRPLHDSVSVTGIVPISSPPTVMDFSTMIATSAQHPSSSSINLPICIESLKLDDSAATTATPSTSTTTMAKKVPPPPLPEIKCNISLDLSIWSLPTYHPKSRSMYTFRCAHDFRRDEVEAHFKDVHADIHGGLDGWIEHRCPLFQYGCNFVHRRWAPHSEEEAARGQRKTFVYNELLEAFVCPMVSNDLLPTSLDDGAGGKFSSVAFGSTPSSSTSLDPDSIECCSTNESCSSNVNISPSKNSTSTSSLLSNCTLSQSNDSNNNNNSSASSVIEEDGAAALEEAGWPLSQVPVEVSGRVSF